MDIVPLELKELNALVSQMHRHHKPVQGHRFSIGVKSNGRVVAGCSVGRPVSREINPKSVLEVTRLVSNGSKNVCSMLYSAAARIGKEMGYKKIQTYILMDEPGISVAAAGWELEEKIKGKPWTERNGIARRQDQPTGDKQRWVKYLVPCIKSVCPRWGRGPCGSPLSPVGPDNPCPLNRIEFNGWNCYVLSGYKI